jgi:hypothetical protein
MGGLITSSGSLLKALVYACMFGVASALVLR